MTYPDGIDALVNVNATDSLAAGGHAARHNSVNTALVEVKDYLVGALGSKLDVAGGKILQIVRATDTTDRSTTSTTPVDVTGMSVTITPQKSDSALIIACLAKVNIARAAVNVQATFDLTDASNNTLSGAQGITVGHLNQSTAGTSENQIMLNFWGYSTPAVITPVTYKMRFLIIGAGTVTVTNGATTGQMYAIEVSA
jgi:hypothetical protein